MVASPSLLASTRRRRCAITTFILVGFLFFYSIPWGVPSSLKDVGISGMSRASIAQLVKTKKPPMKFDEIYGLLHLVTGDGEREHVLSNAVHLDPTHPIDMSIYAAGEIDLDWEKETKFLNEEYPIVVFSKVHQAVHDLKFANSLPDVLPVSKCRGYVCSRLIITLDTLNGPRISLPRMISNHHQRSSKLI